MVAEEVRTRSFRALREKFYLDDIRCSNRWRSKDQPWTKWQDVLNKMAVSLKIRILSFDLPSIEETSLIYLYRFDESKNVPFSYFVLNTIVENGRRVGHICLEMFIRVLKIVEGIMVEKRFVLFCVSRTLNFRHFRASSLYNVAVGGSVAEGQWDAQEARITPVRSSSSIFARLFLFLSELFPVSIMSNEFRMEFRIN